MIVLLLVVVLLGFALQMPAKPSEQETKIVRVELASDLKLNARLLALGIKEPASGRQSPRARGQAQETN